MNLVDVSTSLRAPSPFLRATHASRIVRDARFRARRVAASYGALIRAPAI
ncbi:hypothetical protein BURPS406E_P0374 [Burkholderia pseudomallei 406e]|nr:hypothetical protein BURPS406E_P0374 [Burkholderia pseudomallei 406e]EDU10505.1 hypothetical protein BURPS1655_C0624 [Burkholderia pseudomallei 1655]